MQVYDQTQKFILHGMGCNQAFVKVNPLNFAFFPLSKHSPAKHSPAKFCTNKVLLVSFLTQKRWH